MSTRDIPFDEECHARSDAHREAFGDIATVADLQAMRRRWADNLDRASERLQAEHGKRKTCGGTLAYETMGGAFRVHRNGRYRWRCTTCGAEGENDGSARTHQAPAKH